MSLPTLTGPLALVMLLASTARSEDAPPAGGASLQENIDAVSDAPKSAERFKFLQTAIQRFSVRVMDGDDKVPAPLIVEPLLRYQNPLTSSKDGILVAFSRGGRPDVLATLVLSGEKAAVHEFYAIGNQQVEVLRDERVLWQSPLLEHKFQDLDEVQPPAETATLRAIQMRKLAEEFEVIDDHGWKVKTRQPLRLLRQPVHRYSDANAGIIDGAVFAFVLGTDPEAELLLEAYQGDAGPRWRFAFSPQTIYALQSLRHDSVVWQVPERRVFCNSTAEQYVCPYQFAPDDVPLAGMLPESTAPARQR
jgi:hypothetical protein